MKLEKDVRPRDRDRRRRVDKFLRRREHRRRFRSVGTVLMLALFVVSALLWSPEVAAAVDTEALWGTIAEIIGTWVTRAAGVGFFVGGVMFGWGWKNEDGDRRGQGINTMIAAAIVGALAGMIGIFFGT